MSFKIPPHVKDAAVKAVCEADHRLGPDAAERIVDAALQVALDAWGAKQEQNRLGSTTVEYRLETPWVAFGGES